MLRVITSFGAILSISLTALALTIGAIASAPQTSKFPERLPVTSYLPGIPAELAQ